MTHGENVSKCVLLFFLGRKAGSVQRILYVFIYTHISQAELIDIELWLNPLLNGLSL